MRHTRIVWSDNSITDAIEGLTHNGHIHVDLSSKRLRLHNGGRPDPTPQAIPRPCEPAFIKELTLWVHTDETIPLGVWGGARYLWDEVKDGELLSRWLIITPTDSQQTPAYPVNTFTEYNPIALFDCLEGGKKIIVPITSRDNSLGDFPEHDAVTTAISTLNLDNELYLRHKAVYDHLFQYVFKMNAASSDVTVTHGHRNAGAQLNPFMFAERTGINDSYADYANIWQIGTREMGVSNRVEFYWYIRAWIIAGYGSGDPLCYLIAKFLGMMKDAHGFIETDLPHKKHGRWCGEHSIGGPLGDTDGAKQFHDHHLLKILFPDDADAAHVADLSLESILKQPFWSGGGGARNCGNTLENFWYMWKASGDDRLKVRAHAEIANLFLKVVGGKLYVPDTTTALSKASGGEGLLLLRSLFRWVVDGGGDQGLLPKLKAMLAFYLSVGGRWIGSDKWQACYFFDAVNPSLNDWGDNVHGNTPGGYQEQGIFWVGLRRFAEPLQIAQFDALEKYTYTRFATIKGADDDGWGPGITKWLAILANSLCG